MLRTVFVLLLIAATFARPQTATAQTVPPKPVYLAVGDSLTVGLYATNLHGFASMVADALPGYRLEVAAVTGDGIDNTLRQLPLELADHAPQLVTVEVGINNLTTMNASTFQVRYIQLLQLLQDAGVKTVVTCTVPWTGQNWDTPQYARAVEFNTAIVRTARAFGYTPADCWGATVWHGEYLSERDNFHPNDAGHRAIAAAILDALHPVKPQHWLPCILR
jgi:lysophospholipase L1-like esterase